jgi:hypothetical protein
MIWILTAKNGRLGSSSLVRWVGKGGSGMAFSGVFWEQGLMVVVEWVVVEERGQPRCLTMVKGSSWMGKG